MQPVSATIIQQFNFEGQYISMGPYGCGHINDTYAVSFQVAPGKTRRYILQRINHLIFTQNAEF